MSGSHQSDNRSNGFAGRGLSLCKGLEAFRISAAGISRGLESWGMWLGFHPRNARETVKRNKTSLILWKGCLQLSGG